MWQEPASRGRTAVVLLQACGRAHGGSGEWGRGLVAGAMGRGCPCGMDTGTEAEPVSACAESRPSGGSAWRAAECDWQCTGLIARAGCGRRVGRGAVTGRTASRAGAGQVDGLTRGVSGALVGHSPACGRERDGARMRWTRSDAAYGRRRPRRVLVEVAAGGRGGREKGRMKGQPSGRAKVRPAANR